MFLAFGDKTARHFAGPGGPFRNALLVMICPAPCQPNFCPFLACSTSLSGDEGTRTPDPRLAKAVLSQLSYIPVWRGSGPDWIRTSDPCVISTVL